MRFRSWFIGLKDNREPLTLGVLLVLAVLFALATPAIPIDDELSEDDGIYDSDSWGLIFAVVPSLSSLIHVPTLASKPVTPLRPHEHIRARRDGRRLVDDWPHAPVKALPVVLPFISFSMILAPGLAATLQISEYVECHFGEKRFADGGPTSSLFVSITGFFMTVLYCSAVFFYSRRSWISMRAGDLPQVHVFPIPLNEGIHLTNGGI